MAGTDETVSTPPTRRRASPGYPALDLETAIERVIDLYKASPNHPIALPTAAELWGFSPKSSSSKVAAAALKRYGLVKDVGASGARQIALTDAGREIAFQSDDRSDARWSELVRTAALEPKIYRVVLDHFGLPMPDRRVVMRHLLFELGFQDESGAADFLKRLDATLRFAGVVSLDGGDWATGSSVTRAAEQGAASDQLGAAAHPRPSETSGRDGEIESPANVPYVQPSVPVSDHVYRAPEEGPAERHLPLEPPVQSVYRQFAAGHKAVQIPYSHGQWATLEAAFPMSPSEWTMMMGVLNAMRPGLVDGGDEPET